MNSKKNIYRHAFLQFSGVIVLLITLASCNNDVFYSETAHLEKEEWKTTDTLFYSFDSKDTLASYDFYFEIRNTTDYDLQNLYLFITAYYPGNTYSRDTA